MPAIIFEFIPLNDVEDLTDLYPYVAHIYEGGADLYQEFASNQLYNLYYDTNITTSGNIGKFVAEFKAKVINLRDKKTIPEHGSITTAQTAKNLVSFYFLLKIRKRYPSFADRELKRLITKRGTSEMHEIVTLLRGDLENNPDQYADDLKTLNAEDTAEEYYSNWL